MHELSIATGVIDSVTSTAKTNGALAIKKVNLCVGTSTAIIPQAISAAFDALKELDEYSLCKNTNFNIKIIASKSICLDCGNEYTHGIEAAQCPACMSFRTEITEGSDVYIENIEVELAD